MCTCSYNQSFRKKNQNLVRAKSKDPSDPLGSPKETLQQSELSQGLARTDVRSAERVSMVRGASVIVSPAKFDNAVVRTGVFAGATFLCQSLDVQQAATFSIEDFWFWKTGDKRRLNQKEINKKLTCYF